MKHFCLYRENENSMLIKSLFSFDTGLIDNVQEKRFKLSLHSRLWKYFVQTPKAFTCLGMPYYFYLLEIFPEAIFLTNYYDVGIIAVSSNKYKILFIEDLIVETYDLFNNSLFSYEMRSIGICPTKVLQLDIPQKPIQLMVDNDGYFLTEIGICRVENHKEFSLETKEQKLPNVKLFRTGCDAVIFDKINGHPYPIKFDYVINIK